MRVYPSYRQAVLHQRGLSSPRCDPTYCPHPPLLYDGGRVQHDPTLNIILWGSNWNTTGAATKAELLTLYANLSGSAFQKVLTQYYDTSGWVQSRVSIGGVYTDTSVAAPSNVTDSAIRSETSQAIATNGWQRTNDSQFIVLTAPGSTYGSGIDNGSFCGYHSYDAVGSSYTFVPYEGDAPFASLCLGYDPGRSAANVTSMAAAHEYAESATDPFVNAWLTSDGYEIGDICSTGDVLLPSGAHAQPLWDNHQATCVTSDSGFTPTVVTTVGSTGHIVTHIGSPSGTAVDLGSLGGGFTTVSAAADTANGPLIAGLAADGHVYAKEGDLSGAWVDEGGGNQAVSVASDPTNGPLIAVMSNGHANIKEGSLYSSWVDEGGGNAAVAVAG